jgi:hypothetical protein
MVMVADSFVLIVATIAEVVTFSLTVKLAAEEYAGAVASAVYRIMTIPDPPAPPLPS